MLVNNISMELRAGILDAPGNILFVSMYTENYKELANRLTISMMAQGLPFAVFEVPTVHNSISEKGSSNLNYTKSSFVRKIIEQTGKNVVYIDCDCQVKKFPSLLFEIAEKNDFAIFNWLSHEDNGVYVPLVGSDDAKFYRYSHSIDQVSESQLVCSGAVQFWSNKKASIELLEFWQKTIEENPGSADDHCLDFSFNNFKPSGAPIRYQWLPRSYSRYAWWIFTQPVIDHPQIPNVSTKWKEVDCSTGMRFDSRLVTSLKSPSKFSNGIIDVSRNSFISVKADGVVEVNLIEEEMWI